MPNPNETLREALEALDRSAGFTFPETFVTSRLDNIAATTTVQMTYSAGNCVLTADKHAVSGKSFIDAFIKLEKAVNDEKPRPLTLWAKTENGGLVISDTLPSDPDNWKRLEEAK